MRKKIFEFISVLTIACMLGSSVEMSVCAHTNEKEELFALSELLTVSGGNDSVIPEPALLEEVLYTYEINDTGNVTLTGCSGDLPSQLVLPSEVDGYVVTQIGEYAFRDINVQHVVVPETVTIIGEGAFRFSCIETIDIPESVTSIGSGCFLDCPNLKSISIPGNVETVEMQLCLGCESLEEITLGEGIKTIKWNAFEDCKKVKKVVIPSSVTSIEGRAFGFTANLENFEMNSGNKEYQIIDGCIYSKSGKSLVAVPGGKTTLTIPNGVTEICIAACVGNELIDKVDIPESVVLVAEEAFMYCSSLDEIIIRSPDVRIDVWAFSCFNIFNGEDNSNRIICGYKNSAAYTYATENGFKFKSICELNGHGAGQEKITKSTTSQNGKVVTKCIACNEIISTTAIPKVSSVKLNAINYTYNGKARKPAVTVKDAKGRKLKNGTDYTVTYANGRKNVGKYNVKITFKGNYKGTKNLTFTIKPKSTSISKLTAKEKGFEVKWKKQSKQITGYQIQYSQKSNFKGNTTKTITIKKNSTVNESISRLSAKKKYYVRVRTYKTVKVNGTTSKIYSDWSKAKTVTTKK